MIIAIDIETQGLDATKYLTGCLIKEGKEDKPEIFRDKKKLWERILELARKEAKNGKMLNVYSHNAAYDTAGYIPLENPNFTLYSQRPFIASWTEETTEEKRFRSETEKQRFIELMKKKYKTFKIEEEIDNRIRFCRKKEIIKFLDTMSIYKMSLKDVGETIGIKKQETPEKLKKEKGEKYSAEEMHEIEDYMIKDT